MHGEVRGPGFQVDFRPRGKRVLQSMWGGPWPVDEARTDCFAVRGVHPEGGKYRGFRLVADNGGDQTAPNSKKE